MAPAPPGGPGRGTSTPEQSGDAHPSKHTLPRSRSLNRFMASRCRTKTKLYVLILDSVSNIW